MAQIASAVASVLVPKAEEVLNDAQKGFSYYNKQASIRDIYNMPSGGARELLKRVRSGQYAPTKIGLDGKLE